MTPFSPGDDVFRTSADQQFNSFSNPWNPVAASMAAGVGNWNINPAYMTPSYMSPFRPSYNGPQPQGPSGSPGFWRSAAYTLPINPFSPLGDNYGGNTYQQNQPYFSSLTYRPPDAAMHVAQNFGVPIAAMHAAYKYGGGMAGRMGSSIGFGMARGMGFGAMSGVAGASGMIGGLAGSLFLPAAAAAGVSKFADSMVFDPYVAHRGAQNDLMRNFGGVTFAQGGNLVTGRGMSRSTSAGIASSITRQGLGDVAFTADEVRNIADLSARSGLLDTTGPGGMGTKIKEITKQVKLVMSIANTSDFKETVEILAKLQTAGASGLQATRMLSSLGASSSISGISTQRMMNTVGAQGQMLFGAAGITPYIGMQTAAASHASFSAAFRSGLLSPSLMARMGGVEGATQSSNAGLLALSQSPYAMMLGANQHLLGGDKGSVVGNVAGFGAAVSANPLNNLGMMNLLRPQLSGLMAKGGPASTMKMLNDVAGITPGMVGRNGKIGAGAAYQSLMGHYGLSDDQARARLHELMSIQDPETYRTMMAGLGSQERNLTLDFMKQNKMGFMQGAERLVSPMWRGMKKGIHNMTSDMIGATSSIGDLAESAWYGFNYSGSKGVGTFEDSGELRRFGVGMIGKHKTATKDINALIDSGDKDAVALMNTTDRNQKHILLRKMAKEGKISGSYDSGEDRENLINSLSSEGITTKQNKYTPEMLSDMNQRLQHMGDSDSIFNGRDMKLSSGEGIILKELASSFVSSGMKDAGLRQRLIDASGGKINMSNVEDMATRLHKNSWAKGLESTGLIDKAKSLGISDEDLKKAIDSGSLEDENIVKLLGGKGSKGYAEAMRIKKEGGPHAAALEAGFRREKGFKELMSRSVDISKLSNTDVEDLQAHMEAMSEINDQRNMYTKLHKEGRIDDKGYMSMMNALDSKQSNELFKGSVELFAEAVKVFKGDSKEGLVMAENRMKVMTGSNYSSTRSNGGK